MNGFKAVFSKEMTRVFKDKKMVFSMFVLPVIMMVGIFMLIFTLINNLQGDIKEHVSEVYVRNAPQDFKDIIGSTEEMNMYYDDAKAVDDIKNDIKNGDADILVVFPEGFSDIISDVSAKEVPQVCTYYNPSEDYSSEARDRIMGCLEVYRQKLITDRFGSAEAVMMFTIDSDNAESQIMDNDKATGKILGMIVPYFVTMMIFASAMGLGVDSIAGEKERGTLAGLLLTPVRRVEIVMGKLVSLGVLSMMSALVYVVSMVVALPLGVGGAGGMQIEGFSISLSAVQILEIIVLIIGLVLLYVAIIGLVCVLAKNIKEAQSYITPVYMIVIVVGLITMYTSDTTSMTGYMIPLFNSAVAFKGIFTGEITAVQYAVTAVITYGFAAILIGLTARAFKSEKVMFNA